MSATASQTTAARRVAFSALATFILLAPAMPQVFGVNAPLFRPWVMYSGVGMGLLNGEFEVEGPSETQIMRPEAFFDLRIYPRAMRLTEPYLIFSKEDLEREVAAFCAAQPSVTRVAFRGDVAMPDGWRDVSLTQECAK